MVSLVRGGASARGVARRFGVSLSHLHHWLWRAGSLRLDRVKWTDSTRVFSPPANRTPDPVEIRILQARGSLRSSPLGDCGAQAIRDELLRAGPDGSVPCVRTIGHILKRSGVLDGRIRTRRTPPPPGWYLPALARREAELDSFDTVEGLVIAGGIQVEVLNAMSLHGHLPGSWPEGPFTSDSDLAALRHRSASYVEASRAKHAVLIGAATPLRRHFLKPFVFDPKAPLAGTVILLRRTDWEGTLTVMGRPYPAGQHW